MKYIINLKKPKFLKLPAEGSIEINELKIKYNWKKSKQTMTFDVIIFNFNSLKNNVKNSKQIVIVLINDIAGPNIIHKGIIEKKILRKFSFSNTILFYKFTTNYSL